MSHTPGPWHSYESAYASHNHPKRYWETAVLTEGGTLVATSHGETEVEAVQLARLIAAAPDLLAALKGIQGLIQLLVSRDDFPLDATLPETNHRWIAAEAAIAKAEGGAK